MALTWASVSFRLKYGVMGVGHGRELSSDGVAEARGHCLDRADGIVS